MATWKRLPQECEGEYFFSGQAYMTRGVQDALSPEEIAFIVADLHAFVQQENGVDYLQCVRHVNGEEEHCLTQSELPTDSVRTCLSLAGNGLEIPKGGGQHSMAGKGKGWRNYRAALCQRKVDTAKGLHCMNPSGSSHQVGGIVG